MASQLKLLGRKALVTGSDTGIGREITIEFTGKAPSNLHYSHHRDGANT